MKLYSTTCKTNLKFYFVISIVSTSADASFAFNGQNNLFHCKSDKRKEKLFLVSPKSHCVTDKYIYVYFAVFSQQSSQSRLDVEASENQCKLSYFVC